MNFKEMLSNIEITTEKNQMEEMRHKDNCNSQPEVILFEEIGYVNNVISDKNSTILQFTHKIQDDKVIEIRTNKECEYFAKYIGKRVFLSGLISKEQDSAILYVSSCYSIEEHDDILNS